MTDITILIAVIALALWPVVFMVSRYLHYRNKRLEHVDRMTDEELDNMSTRELVMTVLKQLGCQPEVNEEDHISFKYQGDDFFIVTEEDYNLIMIWNPWWASITIDNEALPYLKEMINAVNMNSLVTTVYAVDEEDSTSIGIHSKCHTMFTSKEAPLDKHLSNLLDGFFSTHDAIKEGLKQLGSAATETGNKDRVIVKGFAAYKDNSIEIKSEEEEK